MSSVDRFTVARAWYSGKRAIYLDKGCTLAITKIEVAGRNYRLTTSKSMVVAAPQQACYCLTK